MAEATIIKDRYGLALTTSSPKAAEIYSEGVDILLEQGFGAEDKFKEAIEADEGFALAHGGLALMLMFRTQLKDAKVSVERACSLAKSATRREQQHAQALSLFINGQGPDSLALVRQHLDEFPRDAMLLRVANRLFMLGCSGAGVANFPEEMFGMLTTVAPQYGTDWAFQGQYAFAHHETGQLKEAYELADKSLAQRPSNAYASHSVAHVFFENGDHTNGGDFLSNWLNSYDKRAPFHVHLSWHQALFELAQGRYESAVDLYESDIRPAVKERSAAALQDSSSLMWRMRMYGATNPPFPIEEIREQASPAADAAGPAFRDAHAAMAFAASGDEASFGKIVDRLKGFANDGDALAREVTLPLIKGIRAFAEEDYNESVRLIEPVFPQLTRIGGSHAQREVFEDTLLEAYIRAGQYDKAEDMLRTRLKQRASVRDSFWLGRVQADTGQQDAAKASLGEVSSNWQKADANSPEIANLNKLTQSI